MLERVTDDPCTWTSTSSASDAGSPWVSSFVRWLREDYRVRASTLEAYTCDIALLSRWALQERLSLLRLTGADLARYLSERLASGTQTSTLHRQLSSWRRFYAFLVDQGAVAASPAATLHGPRLTRHGPRLVPADQLNRLVQPAAGRDFSSGSTYRARRDHAIVWTLYATALGVSDVRLLLWRQIDETLRVVNVPQRIWPLRSIKLDAQSLAVFKALRGCAASEGGELGTSVYCFPTASGLPLSRQALSQVVRRWAGACGISDSVTPSMLRQTGRADQARRRRR